MLAFSLCLITKEECIKSLITPKIYNEYLYRMVTGCSCSDKYQEWTLDLLVCVTEMCNGANITGAEQHMGKKEHH